MELDTILSKLNDAMGIAKLSNLPHKVAAYKHIYETVIFSHFVKTPELKQEMLTKAVEEAKKIEKDIFNHNTHIRGQK